ncbi:hypothetical protein O1M63_19470 [Streptomyces mirabilis]|nr:hypothetical protein [Streptomyces mirabilis]
MRAHASSHSCRRAALTASLCRSSVRTFALDSQGSTASGTWASSRTSPRAA